MEGLPEKIIIAVDISKQMADLFTKTRTKLQVIVQALQMFVSLKSTTKTEFALCLLDSEGAKWIMDFTSEIGLLKAALNGLKIASMEEQVKVFDMSTLLQLVQTHFEQPTQPNLISMYRVLFIYGRSEATDVPIFSMGREAHVELLQHPGFCFDVVYLHQKPNETNAVRQIFDALGKTDVQGIQEKCPNFLFARHHKAQKLMRDFSMLMQHPGLRKPQPKNFDLMQEMLRFTIPTEVEVVPVLPSSSSSSSSSDVQQVALVVDDVERNDVISAEVIQAEVVT